MVIIPFLPIARFFILGRIIVFLANTDKFNYQSYKNCHWEIFFLKEKKVAMGRKMSFMGQCATSPITIKENLLTS